MGYSFVKQTYENGKTLIDAEVLEHLSEGIYQAHKRLDEGDVNSNVEVDSTLKEEGKAADAKAVGDRLQILEKWMEEETYEAFAITEFYVDGETIFEKGQKLDNVALRWNINRTPKSLTLDGQSIDVNSNGHIVSGTLKTKRTWTLVATGEEGEQSTKKAGIDFLNGVYYGVSSNANIIASSTTSSDILALSKTLSTEKVPEFKVNAGAGEYIYYCLPKDMGTCSFNVGGFDGGFSLVSEGYFTNEHLYTETYYVYRSDNPSLGATTVKVS